MQLYAGERMTKEECSFESIYFRNAHFKNKEIKGEKEKQAIFRGLCTTHR